jgi:hypothetical protein
VRWKVAYSRSGEKCAPTFGRGVLLFGVFFLRLASVSLPHMPAVSGTSVTEWGANLDASLRSA